MSSHHVIRDEQEPPVLVLDESFNLELLEELLGWSPLLIVTEHILPWFELRKIKVDGVITTHEVDSFTEKGYRVYSLKNSDHVSLIHKVISEKDYTGINIICNRAVQFKIVSQLKKSDLKTSVTVFHERNKSILVNGNKFKKWYPADQKLKFDKDIQVTPSLSLFEESIYKVDQASTYQFKSDQQNLLITEIYP